MKEYKTYIHHVIDADLYYVGVTGMKTWKRFINALYKDGLLGQYLDKNVGFTSNPNIETVIVGVFDNIDGAVMLEDYLINFYTSIGKSLNSQRSGYHNKNKDELYRREAVERSCKWQKENKEKYNKRQETYRGNHHTELLIYKKVYNYNMNHTPIETPLEAKKKYLEWGYIPEYIKISD